MVRPHLLRRCLFVLATLLCGGTTAWAATITAFVDRNPVPVDESFRLILETDGSGGGQPDFSALRQDFDILNQGQSSNIQIINGNMSRKTQWILTLIAKQAGTFTIPAIAVGRDRSQTLQITVLANSVQGPGQQPRGDIFIDVTAEPDGGYVQAQIIYTVRLYRAVNVRNATLSEPQFSVDDVVTEKLGEDANFETIRNSKRYLVTERRYAIFPQHSGPLTIKPITFEGQLADRTRLLRTKRTHSDSIRLNIRPIPATANTGPWLPAQRLTLTEDWPQTPPLFTVGEPVTRTLTLRASGLTAAQLPAIGQPLDPELKQYPDQPRLTNQATGNGMTARRQEKIAIIPTQAGSYLLPAIEIPWWNTVEERAEIARIPARRITVLAATTAARQAQAGDDTLPAPSDTATSALPAGADTDKPHNDTPWIWTSLLLALGWSVTAIAWWLSRRRQPPSSRARHETDHPAIKTLERELKKACLKNEAQQARTALLQWGRQHWPQHPPAGLNDIGERMGDDIDAQITQLNTALYSHGACRWEGRPLWDAFSQWQRSHGQGGEKTHRHRTLSALYPDEPFNETT